MEQRQQFLLQVRTQIDQQVPAGENVQPGKRRVHRDIVRREYHHLADFLADPVLAGILPEEAGQALRRHVAGNVCRIEPLAGPGNGIGVEVGGENLQFDPFLRLDPVDGFPEGDGQRIRLLAAGAAGDPGAQHIAGRVRADHRGQHVFLQPGPGGRVAEKLGDADQQLLEQQIDFLGIGLQENCVVGNAGKLMDADAALDPPIEGALLVKGKVMPGLRAQQDADFLEGGIPGRTFQCDRHLGKQRMVLFPGKDQPGHFAGRRDDIGEPGIDRAARHGIELGGFRRLHQRQAAPLADRREAGGAIRTHAGQDDADRLFAPVFGQAGEKGVDRQVQPVPGRHLEQVKRAVQDRDILVGRNDIDAIRPDLHPVCGLLDDHRRGALQQFREHAGAVGVEVLDDDKGHAAVGGTPASNCSSASSPPAEAPMPTIGKAVS